MQRILDLQRTETISRIRDGMDEDSTCSSACTSTDSSHCCARTATCYDDSATT